jgi:hypothetical protein
VTVDVISLGYQWVKKGFSSGQLINGQAARKIHSVLAWDDPLPVGKRIGDLTKNSVRWATRKGAGQPVFSAALL